MFKKLLIALLISALLTPILSFAADRTDAGVLFLGTDGTKTYALMTKQGRGWEHVGGMQDPGENWLTAMKREALEETGQTSKTNSPFSQFLTDNILQNSPSFFYKAHTRGRSGDLVHYKLNFVDIGRIIPESTIMTYINAGRKIAGNHVETQDVKWVEIGKLLINNILENSQTKRLILQGATGPVSPFFLKLMRFPRAGDATRHFIPNHGSPKTFNPIITLQHFQKREKNPVALSAEKQITLPPVSSVKPVVITLPVLKAKPAVKRKPIFKKKPVLKKKVR